MERVFCKRLGNAFLVHLLRSASRSRNRSPEQSPRALNQTVPQVLPSVCLLSKTTHSYQYPCLKIVRRWFPTTGLTCFAGKSRETALLSCRTKTTSPAEEHHQERPSPMRPDCYMRARDFGMQTPGCVASCFVRGVHGCVQVQVSHAPFCRVR